ncbi:MAG: alanine dehydrogenase [Bacteroidetes bacterium]|jgi:alanine dehydrogenase|nr:alanine dehydrogenase [Bacteroidota bacterium]
MGNVSNPSFGDLAREASLQPQEKLLSLKKKKDSLTIGVPKETIFQEHRVPLSPMAVQLLVQQGHEIIIESRSGDKANFSDLEYSNAGATVTSSVNEVYKSELIIKIAPPTEDEIDLMQQNQVLISALQLVRTKSVIVKKLLSKNITAIGFEFLRDDEGSLPVIRSMSEIAGRASVMIAAEYLSNYNSGKGELFGGIPGTQPTQIVIIGAGGVGEYATRAAYGLGASVKVFDNSIEKLRRLEKSLGNRVHSSTLIPKILAKALSECDVAIGALRSPLGLSPCVVSEEMVSHMRAKSIIVDVSIDQGGCFETSEATNHKMPVFEKHSVLHYCVPNIASRFSRTASYALSNIFTPLLQSIANDGGITECLRNHEGMRDGTYMYKGKLTNQLLADKFNLPRREIEFLLAGL